MRMVRWMCGVSLREKKTNAELRESMGIEKISDVMRCSIMILNSHLILYKVLTIVLLINKFYIYN